MNYINEKNVQYLIRDLRLPTNSIYHDNCLMNPFREDKNNRRFTSIRFFSPTTIYVSLNSECSINIHKTHHEDRQSNSQN